MLMAGYHKLEILLGELCEKQYMALSKLSSPWSRMNSNLGSYKLVMLRCSFDIFWLDTTRCMVGNVLMNKVRERNFL